MEEHIRARRCELGDLRLEVVRRIARRAGLVAELLDDGDLVGALHRVEEARPVSLAVVVVLEERGHGVLLAGGHERLTERGALLLVDRDEPELHGRLLPVGEDRVAGHHEHLRDALFDRRLTPGSVGRSPQADAGREDVVGDHLLEVGCGLLRVVLVVVRLYLDRAGLAVAEFDATLGVLGAEVRERPVGRAVARSRGGTGQRRADAEHQGVVGDARRRRDLALGIRGRVAAARAAGERQRHDADGGGEPKRPPRSCCGDHWSSSPSRAGAGARAGVDLAEAGAGSPGPTCCPPRRRARRRMTRGRLARPPGSRNSTSRMITPWTTVVVPGATAFVICGMRT